MIVEPITDLNKLQTFCDKCDELGYVNNASLEAMKYGWCKTKGEYFCAMQDDEIVAVGGCHPIGPVLPQVNEKGWRINFRGCELPGASPYRGLNKGNWNTITWRDFIPKFIEFCPTEHLYITTNIDNEHSGKALRNHKLMGLLAKQGMLHKVCETTYFYTDQTIWKLNVSEYVRRRSNYLQQWNYWTTERDIPNSTKLEGM
tara:strand:- start:653 stop:1255 length:603 start_codon:yes stop_codon:yes gene_type:complete